MTSSKKNKILIVEDKQENMDLLVYFLHPQGYEIISVYDGLSALQKVEEEHPDIILLDIMLPKMDGYEVCGRLKKDPETKFIPIIMLTALKELKDKVRALEVGADDFLSKPFENIELLARVKSLLRLKEYHDELQSKNLELAEKNDSLIRMDRFKEDLTNLIIHDMKNPLFVIQGNLQMMSMSMENVPPEILKKYAQRIERSSQQLLRMVVNLLDISRIEEGTIDLKNDHANINEIIDKIIERIKDYPENKNKEILVDLNSNLPELTIDRSVMERVFENLINFSITNLVDEGKVTITTAAVDDQKIQFVTHDNGTQIPKNYYDKIFEKFSQTEIKDSGYRVDRALGLTFCKMAVEAHKGSMWLDLETKVGNKFIIELPISGS
ncbi:MAG: response regulator [Calditrichia bacterium]|nr:response regulator [Calditrichia bacterium]